MQKIQKAPAKEMITSKLLHLQLFKQGNHFLMKKDQKLDNSIFIIHKGTGSRVIEFKCFDKNGKF